MSTIKKNKYDASAIKHYSGLEGVRIRPGMYIGGTDSAGFHHLAWEMLDNAIDEVLAKEADKIIFTLHKDGSVSIEDNGRGIPVGKHESGINTVELIFTKLHAGGKFGDEGSGYKVAGGLHGVGAAVVNALSEFVEITVWRDKKKHTMKFTKGGMKKTKLTSEKSEIKDKTGTKIHFKPDSTDDLFGDIKFDREIIKRRLKESTYLLKGLTIEFIDEIQSKEETFYFENNLLDYLSEFQKGTPLIQPLMINGEEKDIFLEIAMIYTNSHSSSIASFVNNVKTIGGGVHESGAISGINRALNKLSKDMKISQKDLTRNDITEGLNLIISVRVPSTQLEFEGQTKSKLRTPFIRPIVEKATFDAVSDTFLKNKKEVEVVIKKALKAQAAREAAQKARDAVRNVTGKNKKGKILSGKLTPAQSTNKMENELFIVEGDSAGGTAKLGRDKKHQAILPLRGKVLNSQRSKIQDVIKNEELNTLIHTLSCGILKDCDPKKSNYGKIIIMTDADTDGAHIQTLLMTFFYNYMKPLVDAGFLYIANPPLYKVVYKNKKEMKYLWTDKELNQMRKKYSNIEIQRYKGLGEMNEEQLWETTMDPNTRILTEVDSKDEESAEKSVKVLMGDEVSEIRDWIENHVDFNTSDSFSEIKKAK